MNGHANCLLSVCCPPRSPEQKMALFEEMAKAAPPDTPKECIKAMASWVADTFDLAPAGSLVDFKATIAKLARENP